LLLPLLLLPASGWQHSRRLVPVPELPPQDLLLMPLSLL
jgi:hypothetical protein